MKNKIFILLTLLFLYLFFTENAIFSVIGLPIVFAICYLITFLTITFYFSENFFCKQLYFWKKENQKSNLIFLVKSILFWVFFGSILFQINDFKESRNKIIWGCYIEYAIGGVFFIWGMGFILSFFIFILGFVNPSLVRFENRKKIFYNLFLINFLTFLIIIFLIIMVKLFSSNLHGFNLSC